MFSKGRVATAIARLLTLAFVCSTWLTGVAALPAEAQIVTRTATTQSVAVVPFENLSGLRPETFGDEASDAIAVELRDRLFLDVLPKADITIQMRELGFTAPLSDVELVRLAAEMEIVLLVTGQIRAARILDSSEGRYAEVVLAVRLFDRLARDAVNGALVTGRGPASVDASDEVLLRKAVGQAAFETIEEMRSRPTITAMVLWARGDTVFLNVGTRGGMRPGMKLVAIRSGERIAVVNVTDADAIGAYADVVEGTSLRTGDHLRGIYELPRGARPKAARIVQETGKRFDKLLIAAGVLFGLSGFASRARLLTEGGIAAANFTASNMANAAEMGYSGWGAGTVLCTWEPYSNTQESRIVGYEIWRNQKFVDFVWIKEQREDYYIDFPWGDVFSWCNVTLDAITGEEWVEADSDVWDPEIEEDEETGEITYNPEYDDWADGWEADNYIGGAEYLDMHYGWFRAEVIPGAPYYYRVRPLIKRQRQIDIGQYEWALYRETDYSGTNNLVIGVSPPLADSIRLVFGGIDEGVYEIWEALPNPELLANTATFYFYTPIGADEVIVQVARDPNIEFDPGSLYTQSLPAMGEYVWEEKVGVDLTQVPGTGGVFWWRMGARNRQSAVAPRPWPPSRTHDYGYVWSERNMFSLTAMSRAELLHQEREALARSSTRAVRVPQRATGERVLRAQ